ncbi:sterol desaturase family protein [Shimia sp. MMG029]|uniref:sterol desaturase family protein n=1 Tax=Shimia sp. MMG029 TaxID=3021978 RepID=UPI0022FEBD92|nr:sterol desaturase family protein [Shimia sp. MMG029]MDA5558776.1 sterol desaturase family protein [Shimia sp. MMG029]
MDLIQSLTPFVSDFADPKKRIFVGYLGLSVLIAFLWLVFVKRQSLQNAFSRVFDRRVFFSKSSMADYQIFLINRVFTLFVSPLLITQVAIATSIYFTLHKQSFISPGFFEDASKPLVVAGFSLTLFLADDLTKYFLHRWMHKWPPLWAIHKVHHSAETLTPITVYRVHPLEGVLYALRSAFAQGLVLPIFIFAFGKTVDLYTVVGVNVLVFLFHVTGSNLRHSHINISYWPWLERILISPAQHQLHHSTAEKHFDKNFGAALALWDWLFGSLHLSDKDEDLTFGLPQEEASATNLADIYLRPFRDTWRYCLRRYHRFRRAHQKQASPGSD